MSDILCANCGKEGASNTCNKCKMVKYCNAACKKKHKTKHKKACERRVAELRDKELFKQIPQEEDDCPICFIRLPILSMGVRYNSCCGKRICSGCIHAMNKSEGKNELCPFCRVPTPTSNKTNVEWIQKRMALNDANAINNIAGYYSEGMLGLSRDYTKALELWKRAAELGCGEAYYNTGAAYYHGEGVERDMNKARHYYELAAMRGCVLPRHILGIFEDNAGNKERALKHYMIAVEDGYSDSLKEVQDFYSKGYVSKDVYIEALRAYQKYLDEVKSIQRDEAAAAREDYKYID